MQFNKVKSMLKTKGRIIVDEDGDEIILRGVGTGSWMNPEGFLMGTLRFGADMGPFMRAHPFDRGRTMDPAIEELCGKEYAVEFREKWMRVNLAEEDLKCFRQLGFNSIRLALSARSGTGSASSSGCRSASFLAIVPIMDFIKYGQRNTGSDIIRGTGE